MSCPPPENPNNLPEKLTPSDDGRRRDAALAESALKFRRSAQDAMDSLIVDMIRNRNDVGWNKFQTPNGRNCVIAIGVGDDAVGPVTDALYYITHPEEKPDDEPKDPRE